MRTRPGCIAAVVSSLVVGCADPLFDVSKVPLVFDPPDLATARDSRWPLQLHLGPETGHPPSDALVAKVESGLRIHDAATGQWVPFTLERPDEPRWALSVVISSSVPQGAWRELRATAALVEEMSSVRGHTVFDDGEVGVRFREDSWPVLRAIRLCTGPDELLLEFSEAVGLLNTGTLAAAFRLQDAAGGIACTEKDMGTGETPVDGGQFVSRVVVQCDRAPTDAWSIALDASIGSSSGVPIRLFGSTEPGIELALTRASMRSVDANCTEWRQP